MRTIKGDLLKLAKAGEFDVIIHGCNCFCTMGSGIARQIADEFPQALKVDMLTKKGDRGKLGNYTLAHAEGDTHSPFLIVNAYTQHRYDGRKQGIPDVDYDAVEKVMEEISNDFTSMRIGLPMIGAGLAGGDWNRIKGIINQKLVDMDYTLVEYDPNA